MNKTLLNTDIQEFIDSNLKANISDLILKGIHFTAIDTKLIIEQIEAKNRCQTKLPSWFNSKNIYYPNKLNIEQTSSEATAKYKANIVSGKSLIDLTGGFGIDAYHFSKQIEKVTHCEINAELSEIVQHNYKALKVLNITCLQEDGIDVLKRINTPFDWIYIDPSRRDNTKQKVFLLTDCTPNVKTFQGLFLKYAKCVMIKTSPLLDLKATFTDLEHVKEVHVVALNNEVKELLWILERDFDEKIIIKTINIKKDKNQYFQFNYKDESYSQAVYNKPLTYLYEPNAALLKSGGFNSIAELLDIAKLHKHSHLYTSEEIIEFPGRCFKIEKQLLFNKKAFAKEKITKANVTTRNFPISVGDIRKKFKIKDGGNTFLFFTTNSNEDKIILVCSKLKTKNPH